MRTRIYVIISLAILAGLLSTSAWAQYESSYKSRVGISLGVFHPSGSQLQSLGSKWMGPVVDLHLTYDKLDRPNRLISIGLFGEDSQLTKAKFIPITATIIKRFKDNESCSWYIGGGPGLYMATFEGYGITGFSSTSSALFGLNMVAGMDFGGGAWFAELRYDKVGGLSTPVAGNVDFSGITASVGSRLAF